ncbi:PspC domain-containing protein [Arthrobacter sp. NPDC090010]|uniref:PspC domain-containing protein n=1 Tax=Arthrobacter sp. NPDC090010 TaxID=3363942 RepID=UPI003800B1D1
MNTDSTLPEDPRTPNGAAGDASGSGAGPHDGPAHEPSPGQGPNAFFSWIRRQGLVRGSDRWFGGVASGLGHRFGVDPLIVRGLFIVLAVFAGIGVLLYGLAWALLPEPDGRIHAQEAGAGRWSTGMTGAVIMTIIGLPSLGRGFWAWGWNGLGGLLWTLFWLAVAGAVIYMIVEYQRNRRAQHPVTPDSAAPAGSGHPASPGSGDGGFPFATATVLGEPAVADGITTPLPAKQPKVSAPRPPKPPRQPAPQPPRKPRHRGPGGSLVAVTAGCALLVGGGIKALDVAGMLPLGDVVNAVAWAAAAVVLGLGILIAGLRGRSSGFIGFLAVVCLAIGALFTMTPHGEQVRFANRDWNPSSLDQAGQGFELTAGNGTIDLSTLGHAGPLGSSVVVPVDVTAGKAVLILPQDIPVQLRTDLTFSSLDTNGSDSGHVADQGSTTLNAGKSGEPLIVQLHGTFSNITVQEGSQR